MEAQTQKTMPDSVTRYWVQLYAPIKLSPDSAPVEEFLAWKAYGADALDHMVVTKSPNARIAPANVKAIVEVVVEPTREEIIQWRREQVAASAA